MLDAKSLMVFGLLTWLISSASTAYGSLTLNIVPGNWCLSISDADLLAGPGSNLQPVYEDTGSPTYLDVSGTSGVSDNWRIDVKRVDSLWNPNMSLAVKRTSDGTGPGSITGGESYQEIGPTDIAFFSGAGDRSNVPLQMELSGMSLQVAPNTYSTSIVYTVVDL
jgi:hypothetical protein